MDNNERFNLQRRNPCQAGKLVLALYFENHGYENVQVLSGTADAFDMRTPYDGTYKIVMWGPVMGMAEAQPLPDAKTAGDVIRLFVDGHERAHSEKPYAFVASSETPYSHYAVVYDEQGKVLISTLS